MKLLLVLSLVLFGGMLRAADRVALVIGCGKYRAEGIPALDTPVNDARRIAASLRAAPLAFDVVEVRDATRDAFFEALDTFKSRGRGAKVVMVYFSGHGIEYEGTNYCIPVDAVLDKPVHLDSQAIELGRILSTMQATGAEAKVAVLDACRNNPFGQTKSWRNSSGKSIASGVLAALGDAQLPEATLLCFATSPGRKAAAILNDDSQNSPFTEMLLKHLATPGERLRDIFETTADEVARATQNRQIPYVKTDGAAVTLRQLVLVPKSSAAALTPPIPSQADFEQELQRRLKLEMAKLTPSVPSAPPAPASSTTTLAAATKDKPFVNSLGMEFVPVPGTKVLFCRWETRVKDYRTYAKSAVGVNAAWEKPSLLMTRFTQGEDHPVTNVSWEDAQDFCWWLMKMEGQTYRLPTDAEWSIAVGLNPETGTTPQEKNHDDTQRTYPWGQQWPPPKGAGNFADATAKKAGNNDVIDGYEDGYAYTSPVGSFTASADGLYDLAGNVKEWCEDWYDAKKGSRVMRGMSWSDSYDAYLRSVWRSPNPPKERMGNIGFRCVLELPAK